MASNEDVINIYRIEGKKKGEIFSLMCRFHVFIGEEVGGPKCSYLKIYAQWKKKGKNTKDEYLEVSTGYPYHPCEKHNNFLYDQEC